MSVTAWSGRERGIEPAAPLPRPRLTTVAKPGVQAPRLPFVLFVMGLLFTGLIGLLLLNTALQRGAYAATDLRQELTGLEVRRELLQTRVSALQDPQRVTQEALSLGMVENESPVFLSLGTGSIIGKPVAATEANQVDIGLGDAAAEGNGKIGWPIAGAVNSMAADLVTVAKPRSPAIDREKPRTNEGKRRG
ncbi:MAG: hypothetical protein H0V49_05355 [Nocardioidaceae bacterium]|nr:hypothetical protein [Nocardioidaceae bacterium]